MWLWWWWCCCCIAAVDHKHIYNGPSQATIKHEVNEVEKSLSISYIVVSK